MDGARLLAVPAGVDQQAQRRPGVSPTLLQRQVADRLVALRVRGDRPVLHVGEVDPHPGAAVGLGVDVGLREVALLGLELLGDRLQVLVVESRGLADVAEGEPGGAEVDAEHRLAHQRVALLVVEVLELLGDGVERAGHVPRPPRPLVQPGAGGLGAELRPALVDHQEGLARPGPGVLVGAVAVARAPPLHRPAHVVDQGEHHRPRQVGVKPGEVAEQQRRLRGDRGLLVGEPGVGAALAVGVKPGGEAAELGGDLRIAVGVVGVLLAAGQLEQLAPQDRLARALLGLRATS